MIGRKMENALNEQIKNELDSAYLYLSMSAYFHDNGLDGMSHWMRVQTREEKNHALKIFDHIAGRQGRVELKALSEPKRDWESPLAAFKAAYKHEQFITSKIAGLVKLAIAEGDHAAGIMLQWFVTEQVEEEANASKIVQMLERIGPSGSGLVMLDRELGKRE